MSAEREHPESYNDWVQVIEHNDAGVVAQLVVDTVEELEEES